MSGTVTTHIIEVKGYGIEVRCLKCRKLIQRISGKFLLGLTVKELTREFQYLLSQKEPTVCCGERKDPLQSFDTEVEAELAEKEVLSHLEQHGTTEGLNLICLSRPDLN
ncbi:MAG: hypothetical protein K8Q91_01865 [Candidatus Vogelbacteria bacterium]|nr:hypothetical protein [Candidatus Vogelbacteria bacterium]